jgi:2-polyprenyl-3-methyl-5-hydroxy-6-metoxy-1,4-benzoquinol methylase
MRPVPGLYDRGVFALSPDTPELDVPPCPACGETRARPRFGIEGLTARLVVCPTCELGSLHPMPSEAEVQGFYPTEYYGAEGKKFTSLVELPLRLVGRRKVSFLTRGLRPGARVFDLGCGRGVLLSALADRGFEVHGLELSAAAARGADPRARIRIAPTLAAAEYPGAFFDRAVVWHVLEHLRDPAATLVELRRVLAPDGELVISVPNFSSLQARWAGPAWFHLDPPRHLWHFSLEALRRLVKRAGFVVASEHHFSLRQNPFGWVQSALNRDTALPRNGLYSLLYAGHGVVDDATRLSRAQRAWLRAVWVASAPLTLGLSVLEASLRSGATVCVVARPAPGGTP